jgi:hypothetical protein
MGVDCLKVAKFPAAGELNGKDEMGQVAPLRARLKDTAGPSESRRQRETLRNGLRARLFAIDVFARLGREDGRHAVPVRARCDQYRLDVCAGEQVAKVAICRAVLIAVLCVDPILRSLTAISSDVAHRHELRVRLAQEASQVIGPTAADTDSTHHDPITRRRRAVFPQGRGGNHGSRAQGLRRTRKHGATGHFVILHGKIAPLECAKVLPLSLSKSFEASTRLRQSLRRGIEAGGKA